MSTNEPSDIYKNNPVYFKKSGIIDAIEVPVIGLINEYHDYFLNAVNNFFNDFNINIKTYQVDGYIVTKNNGTLVNPKLMPQEGIISNVASKLPLTYMLGGMVYRIISDFYAPPTERIENYAPLSGDYDGIIGTQEKIFYLGRTINTFANYTKIAELEKYFVYQNTNIFINNDYLVGEKINNKFICNNSICDDIYMKDEVYDKLKSCFDKLLMNVSIILTNMGINLSFPTPTHIDSNFIKFTEYQSKNVNLAVYVAGFISDADNVDTHFRIAFPVKNQHMHIVEIQIYENYSQRNILDGFFVNDGSDKYKKIKLYRLEQPEFQIQIISPNNLLVSQTKTLYDRAKRGKIKNINRCRKDYMRIKYLCTLLYNYNTLLPEDDRANFLTECNLSYQQLLRYKNVISPCANMKNIPIYAANDKQELNRVQSGKIPTIMSTKPLYTSTSNYRFSDIDNMDAQSLTIMEKNIKFNNLENLGTSGKKGQQYTTKNTNIQKPHASTSPNTATSPGVPTPVPWRPMGPQSSTTTGSWRSPSLANKSQPQTTMIQPPWRQPTTKPINQSGGIHTDQDIYAYKYRKYKSKLMKLEKSMNSTKKLNY